MGDMTKLRPAISVVRANQAVWEDLQSVFGRRGAAACCQCRRYRLRPREALRKSPAEERAQVLRLQSECGRRRRRPARGSPAACVGFGLFLGDGEGDAAAVAGSGFDDLDLAVGDVITESMPRAKCRGRDPPASVGSARMRTPRGCPGRIAPAREHPVCDASDRRGPDLFGDEREPRHDR